MQALPTFSQAGRQYVLGTVGDRYTLHIANPTPNRVEAVVSIDGLDAVDGKPAHMGKRGYLIDAYGETTIDGWRTSLDAVAAFRFSSVRTSYAARTGHDANVGVIGVAFFRERPAPLRPAQSVPFGPRDAPSSSGAADASRRDKTANEEGAGAAAGRAAPSPPAAARSSAEKSRPGIGTEFGESHDSHVTEVSFERASSVPDWVVELRYDDEQGLVARGIQIWQRNPRDEENEKRDRATSFPEARFAQPPR